MLERAKGFEPSTLTLASEELPRRRVSWGCQAVRCGALQSKIRQRPISKVNLNGVEPERTKWNWSEFARRQTEGKQGWCDAVRIGAVDSAVHVQPSK